MPRGKYVNHKGRSRHFTSPEELEAERKKEEKSKNWRRRNGQLSDESEESDKEEAKESGSSDEEEEEEETKSKGVEGLIAIENPNRVQPKMKKLSAINDPTTSKGPQLSRREREELERQRAAQHYQKLHAEGKTEEARADLARLAIIRQQREEAAKKREEEKKLKEMAKQSKTSDSLKAIKRA